ncbi:DUF2855 family protein [Sphingomonas oligophenolica]|uniref:DUF2855 family protein n=1 Tax=Sphingomonas oligophenolica TaxID=301154 RepID=A0ABU9Y5Q8_9SPHN
MPIKREMMVRRDAIDQTAVNETLVTDPGEGEVLLEIEGFAVTANNVTYAVVGDQLGYWNFFPAPESWGIVPVWGHARVIASHHPDIAVGERVYGYLPMASHLTVQPGRITADGFSDMAAHRQPMSAIYNQYRRLAADPAHDPAHEAERALFAPLFTTSFLIGDQLQRQGWHGASTVIMTSASSKTALAAAFVVRADSPGIRRIGLTSTANIGFVEATGLYDAVIGYDALDRLDIAGEAVLVDFAGSTQVLQDLYAALPGQLAQVLRVGVTHHEARDAAAFSDPTPVWFFAPDAATALIREIGAPAFNAALAERWAGFVADAARWITVERSEGAEALQAIWRDQLAGRVRPELGHIVRL